MLGGRPKRTLYLALTISFLCSATTTPDTRHTNEQKTRTTTTDKVQPIWDNAKKFYIVVAVNKYQKEKSDADLPFAEVDGSEVVAVLEAAGYKPVVSGNLKGLLTGEKATHDNFIKLLTQVQTYTEDARVVVYYSGHGVVDPNERDLWLQMFGQDSLGAHYGESASDIVLTARGRSYTGELAVILDSCFSGQGTITSSLTLKDFGPRSSILTSSSSVQESLKINIKPGKDMSAFTYALKRAIGEDWDKVDRAKEGVVTYVDLAKYLTSTLKTWFERGRIPGPMEPGFVTNAADMVFAYNGTKATKRWSSKRELWLSEELEAELSTSTADKLIAANFGASVISKAGVVSPMSVGFRYPNPLSSTQDLAARFQYPNPSPLARAIAAQIHIRNNPYFFALKAIAERRYRDVVPLLNRAEELQFSLARVMRARAWAAIYGGRYAEAAEWYKRALSLSAFSDGPLTLETANALHLAGENDEAESLYKVFITSAEKTGNLLRPAARNNLATMYATHGDWAQAQPLYTKALVDINRLGEATTTKLDLATVSKNLAYVHRSQGNAEEAATLEKQADDLRAEYEGPSKSYQRGPEPHVEETYVAHELLPELPTKPSEPTSAEEGTPTEIPMHYWIVAVIAAIGALGGFMNVFIGDAGLYLPRTESNKSPAGISGKGDVFWRLGFLAVVVVGSVAAVGSWATLNAVVLIGSRATPPVLTGGDVANALLIGFGGAKWFKSELEKNILRKAGAIAASKVADPDTAATIATGTPLEALNAAMNMKSSKEISR